MKNIDDLIPKTQFKEKRNDRIKEKIKEINDQNDLVNKAKENECWNNFRYAAMGLQNLTRQLILILKEEIENG